MDYVELAIKSGGFMAMDRVFVDQSVGDFRNGAGEVSLYLSAGKRG
jgi:hypothetical protein